MIKSEDRESTRNSLKRMAFVRIDYNKNIDGQSSWQSRTDVWLCSKRVTETVLEDAAKKGYKYVPALSFLEKTVEKFNELNRVTLKNVDENLLNLIEQNLIKIRNPFWIEFKSIPEKDRTKVEYFLENLRDKYIAKLDDPTQFQEKQEFDYSQNGNNYIDRDENYKTDIKSRGQYDVEHPEKH